MGSAEGLRKRVMVPREKKKEWGVPHWEKLQKSSLSFPPEKKRIKRKVWKGKRFERGRLKFACSRPHEDGAAKASRSKGKESNRGETVKKGSVGERGDGKKTVPRKKERGAMVEPTEQLAK